MRLYNKQYDKIFRKAKSNISMCSFTPFDFFAKSNILARTTCTNLIQQTKNIRFRLNPMHKH